MSSEGGDEFGDVNLTGSEHEELLMALDRLDGDSFVLLQRELVDKDENQRPNGSCFLKLRSKHSDDGADNPADDLVSGEISSNVDASDRSSFRLVGIGEVDAGELTESGGDEGRVGETGCCDDLSERGHRPEVNDRMGIVGEGDEDVDHRFEERTTDQASDVGVDGSEGESTSSSRFGVSVVDDLVDEPLDGGVEEGRSADARESTESFASGGSKGEIAVENGVLAEW